MDHEFGYARHCTTAKIFALTLVTSKLIVSERKRKERLMMVLLLIKEVKDYQHLSSSLLVFTTVVKRVVTSILSLLCYKNTPIKTDTLIHLLQNRVEES